MIGRTLGHYRVTEKIGQGGMGEVYRAHDENLDRDVALKILPVGALADEDARKRFRKEALTLAKLNHPHIATVHDFDTQEGITFLVMEYVPGATLAEKIRRGPLLEREVLKMGAEIASALEAAHQKGVVHRDLKPGNIMFTERGDAKVLDFGIAKLIRSKVELDDEATVDTVTKTGGFAGTLPYMAPEQVREEYVDGRTDIWGLGVVLYEAATGQRPFAEEKASRLIASILQQTPPTPKKLNHRLSTKLEHIILRCLEKELEYRYQSAKGVTGDLQRLASGSLDLTLQPTVPKRLAVLPLENLSGDSTQDYFVEGMHEELIATLAKISALAVTSRTSARQYKNSLKPLPKIAEELGVDTIVVGSVRREGSQVRITVRLIEAAIDRHLWTESYQRELRDILTLQSEVARAIADEIRVKVTPDQQAQLARRRPVDPEAYEAYLKGRFHLGKYSQEHIEAALEYFHQAVERDPIYAPAYAGIADVWCLRGDLEVMAPHAAFPEAKSAVLKAMKLDDSAAECHDTFARIRCFYEWSWSAANEGFQRAIDLNPNHIDVRLVFSLFLSSMKRSEEAIEQIQKALKLDPLNSFVQGFWGWHLLHLRKYDEGIAQYRKTLRMEPGFSSAHLGLWAAFHQRQMYEECLEEAKRYFAALGDTQVMEALAFGYEKAGYRGAMNLAAEQLGARSGMEYVPSVRIARLYAYADEKKQALDWLEKAYEERNPQMVRLNVALAWDCLRDDPRFQDLLLRMNFPEFEVLNL